MVCDQNFKWTHLLVHVDGDGLEVILEIKPCERVSTKIKQCQPK